jgi:hypothetical protein
MIPVLSTIRTARLRLRIIRSGRANNLRSAWQGCMHRPRTSKDRTLLPFASCGGWHEDSNQTRTVGMLGATLILAPNGVSEVESPQHTDRWRGPWMPSIRSKCMIPHGIHPRMVVACQSSPDAHRWDHGTPIPSGAVGVSGTDAARKGAVGNVSGCDRWRTGYRAYAHTLDRRCGERGSPPLSLTGNGGDSPPKDSYEPPTDLVPWAAIR